MLLFGLRDSFHSEVYNWTGRSCIDHDSCADSRQSSLIITQALQPYVLRKAVLAPAYLAWKAYRGARTGTQYYI